MKYVISRYNHDMTPILKYAKDYVLYDRSEKPMEGAIVVPNIGSDLYDKFTWIIENYDNLPDVVCLTKANLFKYISEEEFEKVKDNKTFTPLLTQKHSTQEPISFYDGGIYHEINNSWYMAYFPWKYFVSYREFALQYGLPDEIYLGFAPGSNYIVTKKNILKRPKTFYEEMKRILSHDRYPAEAQIIERSLYNIWK